MPESRGSAPRGKDRPAENGLLPAYVVWFSGEATSGEFRIPAPRRDHLRPLGSNKLEQGGGRVNRCGRDSAGLPRKSCLIRGRNADSRRRSVVADTNINFNPNININTSGRGQECPPYGVLLGEADFLDQGCVAGIGVEGVEGEVGAEGGDPEVVFLAGDVEPFEGMIAVAKFRV
jgi:hypothetical protein